MHLFLYLQPPHFPRLLRCFLGSARCKARTTMGVPGLRIRNRTRPGCGGRWLHDGCPSPAMRRLVWAVLHLLLPVSAYEAFLGAIFCRWEVMGPSLRNIGFPCEGNALAISERCRIENRKVMTENRFQTSA